MEDVTLYKKILNAMSAQIAILDETGSIVETNQSWRDFGDDNGMLDQDGCIKSDYIDNVDNCESKADSCINCNYLNICESSTDPDNDGVRVAEGIRKVMNGEIDEFLMQYPCHSPDEKRWYVVRVVPYREKDLCRVIVSHENITPVVEVQKKLEKKEEELQNQKDRLEETNIALRVLLEQRNEDKKNMEAAVFANIDRLVLPYVEKLGTSRLNEKQKTLVDIVNTNLKDIISPFLQQLSSLEIRLTPQEIEVAHLIRGGRSSKEIADILFLSVAGVDFHRKNLRKKLGLTHTKQNLRSFLISLN